MFHITAPTCCTSVPYLSRPIIFQVYVFVWNFSRFTSFCYVLKCVRRFLSIPVDLYCLHSVQTDPSLQGNRLYLEEHFNPKKLQSQWTQNLVRFVYDLNKLILSTEPIRTYLVTTSQDWLMFDPSNSCKNRKVIKFMRRDGA